MELGDMLFWGNSDQDPPPHNEAPGFPFLASLSGGWGAQISLKKKSSLSTEPSGVVKHSEAGTSLSQFEPQLGDLSQGCVYSSSYPSSLDHNGGTKLKLRTMPTSKTGSVSADSSHC